MSVHGSWVAVAALTLAVAGGAVASADRFQSSNYTIDAGVVGNSLGGTQNSTNYRLVSSGGESVIGNAAGGSYKMGQGYVAQLEKAIQLTVQPAGLVTYVPLDESPQPGMTIRNGSGFSASKDLVVTGNVTSTVGKVGNGMNVADTTQVITEAADTPSLNTDPGTAFTYSVWIKVPNGSARRAIAVDSSNCVGWEMSVETNGKATFVLSTSNAPTEPQGCDSTNYTLTYNQVMSNARVDDNAWHHVVVIADRITNKLSLYVDGAQAATPASINSSRGSSFARLKLGNNWNNTDPLTGALDEFKIYNRALSVEEVKAEYDAQNAGIPSGVAFPGGVTPGISNTSGFDVITQTDAPGYTLAINQNQNLTKGADTIPAITGGTIASPVAWSEGSTKGLGFTLYGTNATAIPGLWGSGNNYAALPGTATSFYTRTGYTAGAKDVLNARLRLDVGNMQAPGAYTNRMTVTGTITP